MLHFVRRKSAQGLRANISQGAEAQIGRSGRRFIRRLDYRDQIILPLRPENFLRGHAKLLRHLLERSRPLHGVLRGADALVGKAQQAYIGYQDENHGSRRARGITSCITSLSTNLGAPARRLLNKRASAGIVIDLHQTTLLTNLNRLPPR